MFSRNDWKPHRFPVYSLSHENPRGDILHSVYIISLRRIAKTFYGSTKSFVSLATVDFGKSEVLRFDSNWMIFLYSFQTHEFLIGNAEEKNSDYFLVLIRTSLHRDVVCGNSKRCRRPPSVKRSNSMGRNFPQDYNSFYLFSSIFDPFVADYDSATRYQRMIYSAHLFVGSFVSELTEGDEYHCHLRNGTSRGYSEIVQNTTHSRSFCASDL